MKAGLTVVRWTSKVVATTVIKVPPKTIKVVLQGASCVKVHTCIGSDIYFFGRVLDQETAPHKGNGEVTH